jgi:hypothetical protein
LLLSQGGSRARKGGARPKAPQGHKYNPLGAPRWLHIEQIILPTPITRKPPPQDEGES